MHPPLPSVIETTQPGEIANPLLSVFAEQVAGPSLEGSPMQLLEGPLGGTSEVFYPLTGGVLFTAPNPRPILSNPLDETIERHLLAIAGVVGFYYSYDISGKAVHPCYRTLMCSKELRVAFCALGCYLSKHPALYPLGSPLPEERNRIQASKYPSTELLTAIENNSFFESQHLLDAIRACHVRAYLDAATGYRPIQVDFMVEAVKLIRLHNLLGPAMFDSVVTVKSATAKAKQPVTAHTQALSPYGLSERLFVLADVILMDSWRAILAKQNPAFLDNEIPNIDLVEDTLALPTHVLASYNPYSIYSIWYETQYRQTFNNIIQLQSHTSTGDALPLARFQFVLSKLVRDIARFANLQNLTGTDPDKMQLYLHSRAIMLIEKYRFLDLVVSLKPYLWKTPRPEWKREKDIPPNQLYLTFHILSALVVLHTNTFLNTEALFPVERKSRQIKNPELASSAEIVYACIASIGSLVNATILPSVMKPQNVFMNTIPSAQVPPPALCFAMAEMSTICANLVRLCRTESSAVNQEMLESLHDTIRHVIYPLLKQTTVLWSGTRQKLKTLSELLDC
ncbi:hypothetical protein HDV03_002892 [Kappamyces sp. JEL0829]|nr:hypothetical protein HDV03_002892 [Kappamyces sp. JEL0829]